MATPTVSTCPACRTIDRADGVEDGRLYRSVVSRIGDERTMLRRVQDAQGRVKFAEGYKVLVFIENYGGNNVVAAVF